MPPTSARVIKILIVFKLGYSLRLGLVEANHLNYLWKQQS